MPRYSEKREHQVEPRNVYYYHFAEGCLTLLVLLCIGRLSFSINNGPDQPELDLPHTGQFDRHQLVFILNVLLKDNEVADDEVTSIIHNYGIDTQVTMEYSIQGRYHALIGQYISKSCTIERNSQASSVCLSVLIMLCIYNVQVRPKQNGHVRAKLRQYIFLLSYNLQQLLWSILVLH